MNSSILSVLFIVALTILMLAFFLFWQTRKQLREAKNYERGLKMVPLLIHLPPSSDDVDANGSRDARDIADENISKAHVLYNIIASTAQKGFKSKFYGQRHISLEIVANKGMVYFYAAVPVTLVSVVEQALLSAYPNSRVEEVAEHNIFNPVGKLSGTIGGELVLKESACYPIATYTDLKRDTMQPLLNSLATLDKEDGAGIQILLRPARDGWTRASTAEAEKLRDTKKHQKGLDLVFYWVKQILVAPVKPAEDRELEERKNEKPVSGLNQSLAEAIEEKTRHPGYEVLIRVVASSNISQRAQAILLNIVSTFSLFDAPGKNGFKYLPAKDIESFVTAYILRFFPPEQNSSILNAIELATLFHFPDASNIPTTQLARQASKQVDGPRNLLDDGLLLGYNVFRGSKKPIRLSENDRRRHMYVVGQTGTGKSTFLENLALQDMIEGRGFAFVDPHGDTAEKLLGMVPKERAEDVVYFCPSDMDYPLGLNLFEYQTEDQKDFLIQEVISMLYKLYDPQRQGIIGPRYEHIFRNCALLLMADPQGGTFIDVPKVLVDNDFMKQKLKYVTDQTVIDFWTKEFPNSQRSNEAGEVTSWVVSKFGAFLSNEMMRNIIGQTKSSFDMRQIMDEGKILLVNLSKGRSGELNSKLLGMIFVMKFQAAAMSRANIPESQRKDFSLYVDEFQNFSTDSFATILSEARKYRLNLIVANQFITQLSEEIRDAVFGNIGTVVAHRVGTADAELLEKQFRPIFDIDDLQQLPNYNAVVRMLIGGVPTQPFSMADLPVLGSSNKQLELALKQLSAAKYGRPKAQVESEIFKRLKTEPVPKPAFGAGSPFGSGAANPFASSGAGLGPKPAAQPSFLDEWLAKRKAAAPTGANPAALPSASAAPAVSPTPTPPPKPATFTPPPFVPPTPSPISKASSALPVPPVSSEEETPPKAADTDIFKTTAETKASSVASAKTNTNPQQVTNITSNTIDSKEVNSIADQLRQGLSKPELSAKESTNPIEKAEPELLSMTPPEPKKIPANDGIFEHNDTIHIDKEGNLAYKEDIS